MKKTTKKILNKLNSFDLNVTEENEVIIVKDLFFSKLNTSITFGISNIKIEGEIYRIDFYSSPLLITEKNQNVLNEINSINNNCTFSKFIIDENSTIHLESHVLCYEDNIDEICSAYFSCLISDISEYYPNIMKAIWS